MSYEVVIGCGAGIIARQPRSTATMEDHGLDPMTGHYLPLLISTRSVPLDQAAG